MEKGLSEIVSVAPAESVRTGLPWRHWLTQIGAVLRLELKKGFRRPFGLLLLAAAPVGIALLRVLFPSRHQRR